VRKDIAEVVNANQVSNKVILERVIDAAENRTACHCCEAGAIREDFDRFRGARRSNDVRLMKEAVVGRAK